VNGYGGFDYNDLYNSVLDLSSISKLLFKEGVTTHFPTIITNSIEKIDLLIKQVISLRSIDEYSKLSIEGLHIEGPFISPLDGPRGAHPKEFVRPPEWELVKQWQHTADGLIKIITLSPEWENANAFIEQCVKNDIKVSIGHTNATHNQIVNALSAGATLSTHLGNGMHPVIQRHPNYLWSQLANDQLTPSIIADGFHLPSEVIKVFLRAKSENIFLVSDSVSLAGMSPGDYDLHIGGQVTLTKEGKLHLRGNPSIFAGSASNIKQGIEFLLKNNLTTLSEAWEMASLRPAKVASFENKSFINGSDADIIIVDKNDDDLKIVKTIKSGKVVYGL
jgi:N-acetylglucosamine-6-phosphate deacetylase